MWADRPVQAGPLTSDLDDLGHPGLGEGVVVTYRPATERDEQPVRLRIAWSALYMSFQAAEQLGWNRYSALSVTFAKDSEVRLIAAAQDVRHTQARELAEAQSAVRKGSDDQPVALHDSCGFKPLDIVA